MLQTTKDNGVSPVIAVLLILAMTVVAAGIVAVVTMGMTGDLQNGKEVGLIVKPAASGGDVLVTIVSGKDVPELTKLEVIDGGSADAVFREVKLSGGEEVASFIAGAGYVAEKVAFPVTGRMSYTTPIGVKGTFKDGTETVLLNTKLTFTKVTVSPLYGTLGDFFVSNYDKSINLSLMDLFLYGKELSFTHNNFHISDNGAHHGLTISIPKGMLDEDKVAKITIFKIKTDGTIESKTNEVGTVNNNPTLTVYTVDQDECEKVVIQLDLYNKETYETYKKEYTSWEKNGKDSKSEPKAPDTVGSQSGTITLTGKGY